MPHSILTRPQALRDIEEIFVFFGSDDLKVGFRFLEAIETSFSHIAKHPRSSPAKIFGAGLKSTFRMCPVKGFGSYLIFYTEANYRVEIVRILHSARDHHSIFT